MNWREANLALQHEVEEQLGAGQRRESDAAKEREDTAAAALRGIAG